LSSFESRPGRATAENKKAGASPHRRHPNRHPGPDPGSHFLNPYPGDSHFYSMGRKYQTSVTLSSVFCRFGFMPDLDFLYLFGYSRPMKLKPLRWVGSSYDDLLALPEEVRREVGYALFVAQNGEKADHAKPLKGFGGGVLEVIEDFDGDTWRAVYTVRFASAVYVLHAFQKKSKTGIRTPKKDVDLIEARLKAARRMEEGR
jgi:phage-related protein